jgi:hypothetical protein
MQAFSDNAKNAEVHFKRTASGSLMVRQGSQFRALENAQGRKTAAGKCWERIAGSTLLSEAEAPRNPPHAQGEPRVPTGEKQKEITPNK